MDYLIKITEEFVRGNIIGYDSSHDWWHIERVRRIALYINAQETIGDPFMTEIAALLHDSADTKFSGDNSAQRYMLIRNFLDESGMSDIREQIINIIKNVSFSNTNKKGNLNDPVLLIIQDADRLDAIGAIGIARAFSYGGFRNNPIYDHGNKSDTRGNSTVDHFYNKLLKLKGMMNTPTGKLIAEERHLFLENFLKQFYNEWEFAM